MNGKGEIARRGVLKTAGLLALSGIWSETVFHSVASADEKKVSDEATLVGQREIIKGLDGMSRVADAGNDPFVGGHNAAAVISSAFFRRDEKLDHETQKEIVSLIEARLLTNPIYLPRPDEPADLELVDGLIQDLDAGIDSLRRSGHNIIFAVVCLKALKAVPEAATSERVKGLRKMVQSFGTNKTPRIPLQNKEGFVDLSDEQKFIGFIFEEYLKALELYRNGKGHHGFAGHVVTVGHALVELGRMGHKQTAHKGLEAYWQFVQQARNGANLGGKQVPDSPPQYPTPITRDYWVEQGKRKTGEIVSSHLIKYPYSLYGLTKDLRDDDLKQRIFEKLYYLTAVS